MHITKSAADSCAAGWRRDALPVPLVLSYGAEALIGVECDEVQLPLDLLRTD